MQVSAPSSRMAASAAAAAPCIARRSRTLPAMRTQCSTSFAVRPPIMTQRRHTMRGQALVVHMGIRAVENFDSAFELSQECRSSLTELLSTDTFCQQVGTGWCDSNFWSYTCYAILAFSGPVALVIAVCHLFAYTAHISYSQVTRETQQQEGTRLRFADILFQPVPWSVQTKKVANHLRVGQPAPSMLSSTRRAGRRSMTSLWLIFWLCICRACLQSTSSTSKTQHMQSSMCHPTLCSRPRYSSRRDCVLSTRLCDACEAMLHQELGPV